MYFTIFFAAALSVIVPASFALPSPPTGTSAVLVPVHSAKSYGDKNTPWSIAKNAPTDIQLCETSFKIDFTGPAYEPTRIAFFKDKDATDMLLHMTDRSTPFQTFLFERDGL
ncbi:hypothetical protein T439DRAFT_98900 [Meredithblackwellia eburnea MCA 4105]